MKLIVLIASVLLSLNTSLASADCPELPNHHNTKQAIGSFLAPDGLRSYRIQFDFPNLKSLDCQTVNGTQLFHFPVGTAVRVTITDEATGLVTRSLTSRDVSYGPLKSDAGSLRGIALRDIEVGDLSSFGIATADPNLPLEQLYFWRRWSGESTLSLSTVALW
jgi:hypothetical protein